MRVLIVHNFYTRSRPSGENEVVETDAAVLREHGHEVRVLALEADAVLKGTAAQRVAGAVETARAGSRRGIREALAWAPDVVHLHNPFPMLSTPAVAEVRRWSIPVVTTVHNYRLSCMAGTHFRDGALCHACETAGSDRPGVDAGCYRGSRAQSALIAARRPSMLREVCRSDHFFVLTEHHRQYLVEKFGIAPDDVTLRGNPVHAESAVPGPEVRDGFLFVGRLSAEKGVGLLLDTWQAMGDAAPPLTVIGDGPLAEDVTRAAAASASIRWAGSQDAAHVVDAMRSARGLVVPSTCYEGLPRVVVEAFAAGLPVVGTALGGLRTVIDETTGRTVDAEPANVVAAVREMAGLSDARWTTLSRGARAAYERDYRPEVCVERLIEGYAQAQARIRAVKRSTG